MERSQRYSSAAVAKEGGMRKLRFSSAALSGAGSAFLMDTTAISEPNLVPSDGFVHLIGTSQPDSDASIGVELEDKTMLACFLIIVTDVVATLQSVALIVLQSRGYSMLSLLLVSSLVGAFICGVLMITQGLPVRLMMPSNHALPVIAMQVSLLLHFDSTFPLLLLLRMHSCRSSFATPSRGAPLRSAACLEALQTFARSSP